jgi:hypothetical protein
MRKSLVLAVALVACGDDSNAKRDAPAVSDGPRIDAPRDGSMTTGDAAIGPGAACAGTTCMLGIEDCCIGSMTVCKPTGTCPSQGFYCDGPEDCPNAVCCFPNASNGSRCQTNNCQDIACHTDGDCPSGTSKCCPKSFTPGYNVCQTAC